MKALWPVAWIAMAGAAQATDLPTGAFRVVALDGAPVNVAQDVTIVLDQGRVTGSAGCNRYFGTVAAQAPLFLALGTTRMACDPALMALEDRFLAALARVDALDMDKETLTLLVGSDPVIVARR
jgi:putative lipoprotein